MSEPTMAVVIERIDGMKQLMSQRFDVQDQKINDIQKGQSYTNGRVKKAERYQYMIMGAVGIITVLVLPILFMIVSSYLSKVH